jgi:hypothetical protein
MFGILNQAPVLQANGRTRLGGSLDDKLPVERSPVFTRVTSPLLLGEFDPTISAVGLQDRL